MASKSKKCHYPASVPFIPKFYIFVWQAFPKSFLFFGEKFASYAQWSLETHWNRYPYIPIIFFFLWSSSAPHSHAPTQHQQLLWTVNLNSMTSWRKLQPRYLTSGWTLELGWDCQYMISRIYARDHQQWNVTPISSRCGRTACLNLTPGRASLMS